MDIPKWRVELLAIIAGIALAGCLPEATPSVAQAPAEGPPNSAPAITGAPAASITAGTAYSFMPTASDPDGQALSYSIANKPAWASFSTTTGRLTGTPADAHVGTTPGIVITVTDSAGASAALPAFSITVAPAAFTGTAALTWMAPAQYTDGSPMPIGELDAYRVYRGTSAASLARIAEVDSATTAFNVSNLTAGTHYFAVTAVSINGLESSLSQVGSKTIL
jgi:hypothetical protein